MKKRLIFDLDNTLIEWKEEYTEPLRKTLEEYKVNIDYKYVDAAVLKYEDLFFRYDKRQMIMYLNDTLGLNLNLRFMDSWIRKMNKCAESDPEVIETLKYLSSKYELVVLTNWFTSSQKKRLKKAKMDKYFKEVFGGDYFMKPNGNAFLFAIGDRKKEECVMIGDSYKTDIEGALDYGIDAIMISKDEEIVSDKYKVIKNFKDLTKIL